MKRIFQKLFSRGVLTAVFIVLQIAALVHAARLLNENFAYFYAICLAGAALLVLHIVSSDSNPAYKIAWIIPVLALPVFGALLFVVFGKNRLTSREKDRMSVVGDQLRRAAGRLPERLESASALPPDAARMSDYIRFAAFLPAYGRTETEYLPVGEVMFERMLAELQKAQRFIFLEYYIIRPGRMWDAIHEILVEKVRQGLEVRVLYDDFGCMYRLPDGYDRVLEREGIRCCVFNPFRPVLSPRFNNRDHRKICVIDGVVGFTGGVNISDEYINAVPRCGHWLDSGVLLRGDAVSSLTMMFLSVWGYSCGAEAEDVMRFLPDGAAFAGIEPDGVVQPFTDSPLDSEAAGETVYLQLLHRATEYVYINTPYLIIDNEMVTAMTAAAKSGVDVRIVTPAVCDSRIVQEMTRSYYATLLSAGVKIYEYTPGMVHAKTFVADDRFGVVGTINLDYRSLYLHFECAVWMYKTRAVAEMKAAYLDELTHCTQVTREVCERQSRGRRLLRAVLRVLAPLF